MSKQVITFLPDEDYEKIFETVKRKGRYSEVFWPDKVETKMWLHGGKLMSQMKGELLIKQILPNSKMDEIMGNEKFIGESGFSQSVEYIKNKFHLPLSVASRMMMELYKMHGIPKQVALPKKILDSLEIGVVKDEEDINTPSQSEDLASNKLQKEQ